MELTECVFPPIEADELKEIRKRITTDYDVRELYNGYSMLDFTRTHMMAQRYEAGKEFKELLIGNYDLFEREKNKPKQLSLFVGEDYEKILKESIVQCKLRR